MYDRPVQSIGRHLLRSVVAVLAMSYAAASAQIKAPDEPAPSATATFLESLDSLKSGTHLIFKDPGTGRVVEYPGFPDEWLERAMLQTETQLYDLQNVAITGQVKGELVQLDVEVQVDVRVDDEWVRVPLEFADFQLIEPAPEHSMIAPAEGSSRFEKERQPTKSWQLYGKGAHRLTFRLIGQIRPIANNRQRIRIAAPLANQSRFTLQIPGIVSTAELSTGKPMEVRVDAERGVSEIETWGMSEATDVTWTPESKDAEQPTTVQATTAARMKLDLTTEPASLVVQQPLAISGGSIDHLDVQLPKGFSNAEITGTDANNNPIVRQADVSETGFVSVALIAPITGAITLNYSMEPDAGSGDVTIQLPDITAASNETADLDLIVPFGLDVVIDKPEDGSVRQDRVKAATDGSVEGVRQAAFRLLSEEARLKLSIREPEAFYSVVPSIDFETDGESILMAARFSVNVLGGSLNQMDITWPGYEADGWQILDGYTRLVTDTTTTIVASPNDGNSVTLEFPARQSRQFTIEVQAFRDLKTFQERRGLLFLPDIRTPTPHTATVSLIESDAHSMVLSSPNSETAFPQLPPSRWPELLRQRKEPLTVWLVDSTDEPVQLDVTKQRPEIRVSVLAEVAVVNDTIHVSETLTYNVRHRDVTEVRLRTGNVKPSVRLQNSNEPLQQLSVQDGIATYGLPTAMRGEFELMVDFLWAPSSHVGTSGEQTIELPLVLPSAVEETIESVQVATNVPETLLLRREKTWTRIYSDRFSAAWSTTERPSTLPMILHSPLRSRTGDKPQLLVVNSVLMGNSLVTSTTAVFARRPDIVVFSLPPGYEPRGGMLGGTLATCDVISSNDDSGNRIVQVRAAPGSEPETATATLVIEQNLNRSDDLVTRRTAVLPRPVSTDRDCNCLWVLRQSPDRFVYHWAGSMSELAAIPFGGASAGTPQQTATALVDLLAPLAADSRQEMTRLLEPSLQNPDQHQILVGTAFQRPQTLVVISRQAMLLATAIAGLLLYFAIIKLSPLPLITTLVLMAAGLTAVFANAPGPSHALLIRFLPGCVVGTVAAILHRGFAAKPVSSLQGLVSEDGSTIFAVEQPLPTHIVPDAG